MLTPGFPRSRRAAERCLGSLGRPPYCKFCWRPYQIGRSQGGYAMPKYLISASYSAEGLRGLQKDKASGRRQAVTAAVEGLGGTLECFYNALGAYDVYVIVDLPDNSTAAAIGVTVSATGLVRTRTTALLTVEETDRALEKSITYRPPGR